MYTNDEKFNALITSFNTIIYLLLTAKVIEFMY